MRPDEPVSAIIASFPEDTRLCPVTCFKLYLPVTSNLRTATKVKPNRLFVSYIKPHHPMSPSTIACWIWELLTNAGIGTSIFKAHSMRGASTSGAASKGFGTTLKKFWSAASTFQKIYYKPIINTNFGHAVLSHSHK